MDILTLNVAPATLAILGLGVVAIIKLIDQLFDRDFRGAAKIVGAAVIGLAVAYGVDGLAALPGVALGLSASGLLTTVSFGRKSATPVVELG